MDKDTGDHDKERRFGKAIFKEMYAKYGNGGYDHLLDDALKGTFNNKTLTKV